MTTGRSIRSEVLARRTRSIAPALGGRIEAAEVPAPVQEHLGVCDRRGGVDRIIEAARRQDLEPGSVACDKSRAVAVDQIDPTGGAAGGGIEVSQPGQALALVLPVRESWNPDVRSVAPAARVLTAGQVRHYNSPNGQTNEPQASKVAGEGDP